MKLSATSNNGFSVVRFETVSGYSLSCGIGKMHYCDNYDKVVDKDEDHVSSSTMEIAILDKDGAFDVIPGGVAGWIPVSSLTKLLIAVGNEDWDYVLDVVKD